MVKNIQSRLRIERGTGAPREIALDLDELTIGRGLGNDLHFGNPWLSRLHARIIRRAEEHFLVDLGSRNGTYLNGQRISAVERRLSDGDVIALREIRLRYLNPAGSLAVAESQEPLSTHGTVLISSDELVFDRYRAGQTQVGTAQGETDGLLLALTGAASALITHYPLDELVELVMGLIIDAIPAERGAILLRSPTDAADLKIKAVYGYGGDEEVRISRTITQEVIENQKAVLTVDAQADDRFGRAESIMMQGIRSIICVPLWNNRDVIGMLYLDHRLSDQAFSENELRLAGLLANMAAVKIENAVLLEEQLEKKRMEEQLAVGAKIQRGLLPSANPCLAGYDICGVNQSCYEIGGDYYDFITREDGKLALVIADVAGKGVGAALLMAVLQASLRALIPNMPDPAALVHQLNRVLIENSPANKFATLFYAELDPETHRVEYVSGGHNPTLLCADGVVRELESTGPIVGLVPGVEFESRCFTLPPNGTLLLYTDGITEIMDESGDEFGTERLAALLAEDPSRDSKSLVEAVRQRMDNFSPVDGLDDDTTLVVVRRLPVSLP